MKGFVIKIFATGFALWLTPLLVRGIHLGASSSSLSTRLTSLLLVTLLFGLVNAVLKPIVKFFSWPAIVLTLGLFTLVVNAFMLQVTSWLAGPLGLDFRVESFGAALAGALVIAFVSMIAHLILSDDDD